MADRRYEFTDNQGRSFNIYAADWEEAWRFAQITRSERDATARQESYQRAEDLKDRVDKRTQEEVRDWREFSAHREPRDNSPHIPWGPTDEAARGIGVDGGACAIDDKPWLRGGAAQATRAESVSGGSILATLGAVLAVFAIIAVLCSSCGEIVRLP